MTSSVTVHIIAKYIPTYNQWVASERIWKCRWHVWARSAWNNLCRAPPLFGSKSPFSRFSERFRDCQYSLVSFLFYVLLLTVPPCPAICKSRGHLAPVPYGVDADAYNINNNNNNNNNSNSNMNHRLTQRIHLSVFAVVNSPPKAKSGRLPLHLWLRLDAVAVMLCFL